MELLTVRRALLPLAILFLLTGCKDPEIEGTWNGSDKSFNPSTVVALFSGAEKELGGERVSISTSLSGPYNDVFYVTLGDKKHSKEWVEQVLAKVEQYQASFNSTVTVEFTDIADAKNKADKELLEVLHRAGMEQKGSHTAEINWAESEVIVYTEKLSIGGVTDPYSNYDRGYEKVYCKLRVPLNSLLPGLVINDPVPDITAADIPDKTRSLMSEKQADEYIKAENDLRRFINIGLQVKGRNYPNTTTFSDEFFKQLALRDGLLSSSTGGYSLNAQSIEIAYGAIPDANYNPMLGGDLGGVIHSKCEEMVKTMTPELNKKKMYALQYKSVGKMKINSEWKPES